MIKHFYISLVTLCPIFAFGQNVGIGTNLPPAKLTVNGTANSPSIPGSESTGVFRIGVSANEGLDIGKMALPPFTGWIQAGYDGIAFDPISIQPVAGNVGIGVLSPTEKLEVNGNLKVDGIISGVSDPISAQDAATKAYVDFLETKVASLEAEMEALNGVKDIDNNRYDIVTIGTQTWMAENLKTTRYNDGTVIPLITDGGNWTTASNNGDPAYCWYDNASSNLITYGALYNWYAIDTLSNGDKNVCPIGWHVPTDGEWTTLTDYLGGTSIGGGKMKEAGLAHWNSPNIGATNESGFAVLPGGFRLSSGTFGNIGLSGSWWSSTEGSTADAARSRGLNYNSDDVGRGNDDKGRGFSVRCLRD